MLSCIYKSSCNVRYHRKYTPIIIDFIPRVIYPHVPVIVTVNTQVEEITVNGMSVDVSNFTKLENGFIKYYGKMGNVSVSKSALV